MKRIIIKNVDTGEYIKSGQMDRRDLDGLEWTTNPEEAKEYSQVGHLSWFQSMLAPVRLSGIDLNHSRIQEFLDDGGTL